MIGLVSDCVLSVGSLSFQVAVGIVRRPPAPLSPPAPAHSSSRRPSAPVIRPMVWPAVLGPLVEAQPQGLADNQALHYEGGAEPGHGVLGRDESHEVVAKLGVVPGAGVELAQQQPRAELPQVRP